jgi:hypothetical protein
MNEMNVLDDRLTRALAEGRAVRIRTSEGWQDIALKGEPGLAGPPGSGLPAGTVFRSGITNKSMPANDAGGNSNVQVTAAEMGLASLTWASLEIWPLAHWNFTKRGVMVASTHVMATYNMTGGAQNVQAHWGAIGVL